MWVRVPPNRDVDGGRRYDARWIMASDADEAASLRAEVQALYAQQDAMSDELMAARRELEEIKKAQAGKPDPAGALAAEKTKAQNANTERIAAESRLAVASQKLKFLEGEVARLKAHTPPVSSLGPAFPTRPGGTPGPVVAATALAAEAKAKEVVAAAEKKAKELLTKAEDDAKAKRDAADKDAAAKLKEAEEQARLKIAAAERNAAEAVESAEWIVRERTETNPGIQDTLSARDAALAEAKLEVERLQKALADARAEAKVGAEVPSLPALALDVGPGAASATTGASGRRTATLVGLALVVGLGGGIAASALFGRDAPPAAQAATAEPRLPPGSPEPESPPPPAAEPVPSAEPAVAANAAPPAEASPAPSPEPEPAVAAVPVAEAAPEPVAQPAARPAKRRLAKPTRAKPRAKARGKSADGLIESL